MFAEGGFRVADRGGGPQGPGVSLSSERHDCRFAEARGATLTVPRSSAGAGEVSLSPHTVRAASALERLVLPSPNGATISAQLAATGATALGVSLRNRHAAAAWLRRRPESVCQRAGPCASTPTRVPAPAGLLRGAVQECQLGVVAPRRTPAAPARPAHPRPIEWCSAQVRLGWVAAGAAGRTARPPRRGAVRAGRGCRPRARRPPRRRRCRARSRSA